jgi:hypothetical protein
LSMSSESEACSGKGQVESTSCHLRRVDEWPASGNSGWLNSTAVVVPAQAAKSPDSGKSCRNIVR